MNLPQYQMIFDSNFNGNKQGKVAEMRARVQCVPSVSFVMRLLCQDKCTISFIRGTYVALRALCY